MKLKRIKQSTDGEIEHAEVAKYAKAENSKKHAQKSMKLEKVKPGEELDNKKKPESFLIVRNGDSTPFGHIWVPNKYELNFVKK